MSQMPLTRHQMTHKKSGKVWLQDKYEMFPSEKEVHDNRDQVMIFTDYSCKHWDLYGETWILWKREPTEEERSKVFPWNI